MWTKTLHKCCWAVKNTGRCPILYTILLYSYSFIYTSIKTHIKYENKLPRGAQCKRFEHLTFKYSIMSSAAHQRALTVLYRSSPLASWLIQNLSTWRYGVRLNGFYSCTPSCTRERTEYVFQFTTTHENMRIIFSFDILYVYNTCICTYNSALFNFWVYANRHNTIWISYECTHQFPSLHFIIFHKFAHVCVRYARIKLRRYDVDC